MKTQKGETIPYVGTIPPSMKDNAFSGKRQVNSGPETEWNWAWFFKLAPLWICCASFLKIPFSLV